jgi:TPR repeat protein
MRQAGRSIVVAVLLAMTGAAVAGQLEDGQAAIKRHDYANAMRLLEPLAEQGNADAQYEVAKMYARSDVADIPGDYGFHFDSAKALKFFKLAAMQGHVLAMVALSEAYIHGWWGTKRDPVEGGKWQLMAAEKGYPSAQYFVGIGYYYKHNYAEAFTWLSRAAEQGEEISQNMLGILYLNGQGAPQDYATAHMWFNLSAAASGNPFAVANRAKVEKLMTPDQMAEAQRMAREWKPKQ